MFTPHRLTPFWRQAVLWMVGPLALAVRGRLAELVSPVRCAGALDLVAAAILRRWPALSIGQLILGLQTVVVVVALGSFASLVYASVRRIDVTIAATVSLWVGPLFGAALAPPWEAAAFAACIVAAAACSPIASGAAASSWKVAVAWLSLLGAALLVPSWSVAASASAFCLVWLCRAATDRSARLASAASAAVTLLVLVILMLRSTPTGPLGREGAWFACLSPSEPVLATLASFGSTVLRVVGPLGLALAALGMFVRVRRDASWRVGCIAVAVALAVVQSAWTPGRAEVGLAPVFVAIWWLAAAGLVEVVGIMGRSAVRSVAAALLMMAVPFLEWSRIQALERDDIARPAGHERVSLAQMTRVLNLLPSGSTLVEEDASIDTLLRATVLGHRRATKPLAIIPLARKDVVDALQTGRVYAFPHGQSELSLRGFAVERIPDSSQPAGDQLRGIAAISAGRACADLAPVWIDLKGIGASGRVALSAASEDAAGPALVYFGSADGFTPEPDAWPPRAVRGFGMRMFKRRSAEEIARLEAEASEAGLSGNPALTAPFVARLTLFRTPGAPLALPVTLGTAHAAGVGRMAPDRAGSPPLTLCDAPVTEVTHF